MLVKLYDLPEHFPDDHRLTDAGIFIRRALPIDRHHILHFIRTTFNEGWASECEVALSRHPVSCFIAVKDKQIIGFACYDATAKGFFGPTGVSESMRGQGIGKQLLLRSLISMREEGYAYAIIGWVSHAIQFYEKTVQATVIDNSFPGVYRRMIRM